MLLKNTALGGMIGLCLLASQTMADEATQTTIDSYKDELETLDFADKTSFTNASRGLMAVLKPGVVENAEGEVVWDQDRYSFLEGDAPETANPSLWRQGQLNAIHGLFEVTPGIYQVRGLDLGNMTLIEGESGWILIDPLTTNETARASLEFANRELGARPVSAIIYTHSHADHFGGARGIFDHEGKEPGEIQIIAPDGFMEHAISEGVLAGNVMARRSSYHFGNVLPAGPDGQIGSGLGQTTSSGVVSLIAPDTIVAETGTQMTVDGVEIEFQMANGSEAPAEFMFYFPQFKALCLSEVTTHTLHNTYTLRGARMRDVLAWSEYINETIQIWGDEVEIAFASHHWPTWGNEEINDYLLNQRDVYRFIHDETLRLANHGYGPREIANMIKLPEPLTKSFATRGYYGSLKHNSEAVYNFYLGWFDGNPANIDRHPPVESAKRYVKAIGGAERLLEEGRAAFDAGDYRWVAELVNHLVFAEPGNKDARELQAAALTQLGFQAESGSWRNFYLSAAHELRNGVTPARAPLPGPDTVRGMSLDLFFDFLGVKLNPEKAGDAHIIVNFDFTDIEDATYLVELRNGVLNTTQSVQSDDANVTLSMTREALNLLVLKERGFPSLVLTGDISFTGNPLAFRRLMGMLDDFEPWFNLATP